ncbi:GNAT family N-acetyltransferase [Deinococcus sp.]|uniref:GNAT family N-acetyltransferase n=1 Tax=Deinococcus sp. TaxID=47478 RepID=UPI003C7A3C38
MASSGILLPEGQHTPDNFLYDLHDPGGSVDPSVDAGHGSDVGVLWYALRGQKPNVSAFVYEIEIFAQYRRRGHVTRAFGLLEYDAAARGAQSLQLHVFGHNSGARPLHEGLGFFATDLMLRKNL